MAYRVLCFGDSNTWGYDPSGGVRFDDDVRWTGVLANTLGKDYTIIEAGLNGRTTVFDDPFEAGRNGKTLLPVVLQTHKPLDLVILMLGTNDFKEVFSASAFAIRKGMETLVTMIQCSQFGRNDTAPPILLMSPPPLAPNLYDLQWGMMFGGGLEKSHALAAHYQTLADEYGLAFFDTGTVIQSSTVDGIHFDQPQHTLLGEAVAEQVQQVFK
jgi:lysophospholipase L1-like esterase